MKVKKTKLPENLYHYTSLIKYRMILATGKLAADAFQSKI